jgi:hypothetical protein
MWQKTELMKVTSTSVELCSKAGNSVGLSLTPSNISCDITMLWRILTAKDV